MVLVYCKLRTQKEAGGKGIHLLYYFCTSSLNLKLPHNKKLNNIVCS